MRELILSNAKKVKRILDVASLTMDNNDMVKLASLYNEKIITLASLKTVGLAVPSSISRQNKKSHNAVKGE